MFRYDRNGSQSFIPHLDLNKLTFGGAAFAMDFRAFTFIITCDLMVKMHINHVVCTATTNWEVRIILVDIFRAGPKT